MEILCERLALKLNVIKIVSSENNRILIFNIFIHIGPGNGSFLLKGMTGIRLLLGRKKGEN